MIAGIVYRLLTYRITRTITALELTFTVLVAIGALVASLNLREARRDLRWVKERHINTGAGIVSRGHVRDGWLLSGVLWGFAVVGAMAMAITPPPQRQGSTLADSAIGLIFVVEAGMLDAISIGERQDRKKILTRYRKVKGEGT